ncbi:MAG: cyclic pyranopterin monophosphate synthase MoaC [Acidobacteria bacterium]|nr:cyclic pyranopterin monophosphate synthase MoaC [Acidobacteriota bacterium]
MAEKSKRRPRLSHYGARGQVQMVDVGSKPATLREARAHAFVRMKPAVARSVRRLRTPKGNPLEVARIAGIAAAKRTAELIPLCHPLLLTHIDVQPQLCHNGVRLISQVRSTGPTGVEMEALTAVAVAALTVYDMLKGLDRSLTIGEVFLLEKLGGKSGVYRRPGRARGR